MKVYMVHFETGQYSDMKYKVLGIFTSREKAERYLGSTEVVVTDGASIVRGYEADDLAMFFSADEIARFGTARPIDQGDGRWLLATDDLPAHDLGNLYEFFITEYELDDAFDIGEEIRDL